MAVVLGVVILIASVALFMFYLQAACQRILRREFAHKFFHLVVNANRLDFPLVRNALEQPVDYDGFRRQLKCDFLNLTYLLKNPRNAKRRLSKEERLLTVYFRAVFSVVFSLITYTLGLSERYERAVVLKLISILEYFAKVLSVTWMKVEPREPSWRTHARWCLASFTGMFCMVYSAVLGASFPRIGAFPAFPEFPVLLAVVCLLFLIIRGSR